MRSRSPKVAVSAIALAVLLLLGCKAKEDRWEKAAVSAEKAAAAPMLSASAAPKADTGSFNKFFPADGTDGASRVFSADKEGYAEAKLSKDGKEIALLAITDLNGKDADKKKFEGATEKVDAYPVATFGKNKTMILVKDSYQVQRVEPHARSRQPQGASLEVRPPRAVRGALRSTRHIMTESIDTLLQSLPETSLTTRDPRRPRLPRTRRVAERHELREDGRARHGRDRSGRRPGCRREGSSALVRREHGIPARSFGLQTGRLREHVCRRGVDGESRGLPVRAPQLLEGRHPQARHRSGDRRRDEVCRRAAAFCLMNGLPGDSIGYFVDLLMSAGKEDAMRLSAWIALDVVLRSAPTAYRS